MTMLRFIGDKNPDAFANRLLIVGGSYTLVPTVSHPNDFPRVRLKEHPGYQFHADLFKTLAKEKK